MEGPIDLSVLSTQVPSPAVFISPFINVDFLAETVDNVDIKYFMNSAFHDGHLMVCCSAQAKANHFPWVKDQPVFLWQ